jgi:peroxiredoxin
VAKKELPNPPPHTLEGFYVLHQFFRVKRDHWRAHSTASRAALAAQAAEALTVMSRREDGDTALFSQIGHKGDLILIHFRRGIDDLSATEKTIRQFPLSESLEPINSYLSVIEIGLYEATVKLERELREGGIEPYSAPWHAATQAELADQKIKLASRLWPKIPDRRYVCFYPMNKRRAGSDNWYSLTLSERQRLMHEHGLIGRRYAGRVNQVISGSIGLDDWEWGVDLFADDPIVFKQLVYEMRFDESSARFAEFGPFTIGIRLDPASLADSLE